jgi:hypothetical protein
MRDLGLTVYLTCIFLQASALFLDRMLYVSNYPTISAACRRMPYLAIPIYLVLIVGAWGLALHLWGESNGTGSGQ